MQIYAYAIFCVIIRSFWFINLTSQLVKIYSLAINMGFTGYEYFRHPRVGPYSKAKLQAKTLCQEYREKGMGILF